MHESAPLFREEQRFSQPWLWAIVVVAAVAAWIGLAAVVLDSDDGAGWPVAIVLLFVAVGLPLLFARWAASPSRCWPTGSRSATGRSSPHPPPR